MGIRPSYPRRRAAGRAPTRRTRRDAEAHEGLSTIRRFLRLHCTSADLCRTQLVTDSARTKFLPRSARAVWAKSIGQKDTKLGPRRRTQDPPVHWRSIRAGGAFPPRGGAVAGRAESPNG